MPPATDRRLLVKFPRGRVREALFGNQQAPTGPLYSASRDLNLAQPHGYPARCQEMNKGQRERPDLSGAKPAAALETRSSALPEATAIRVQSFRWVSLNCSASVRQGKQSSELEIKSGYARTGQAFSCQGQQPSSRGNK
ncbi:Set And Mynd Domain-Containing Protein 4 [Manis pentadactyla]|nr:Set And Mynd Domain-Containing Protein 4 [Manis pentadactyla]